MPLSTPQAPSTSLAKDALWYAAAAAALGLTTSNAEAQIVYTDVDPDVTLVDADFPVDFDGDGDPELIISESTDGPYIAGFGDTAGGADAQVAIVSQAVGAYQYFLPLSGGQTISTDNVATTAAFQYGPTFTFSGADPNGWIGAGDKYAGIQFLLDSGDTHFGWILLDVPSSGTVIIKAFAYEATADTAIEAGEMPVAIEPGPDGTPGTHALSAVYPNPFNPQASFSLEVAEQQNVRVEVFNALGQRVAVLHDGALSAGSVHPFEIDGSALTSGVYLVRATGETFADTRMVTLAK